jgi:hypothetical protein
MEEGQMQVCSSPRSDSSDDRSGSRDGGEVVVGSGGGYGGMSDVGARFGWNSS